MTVADYVARCFINNSIEKIFLYPGGTIAPIINSCIAAGIEIECFKSEQGAGYAALAYARVTGRPQVLLVTSGPGLTNSLSCLADAFYDSTPLVLIAGQISTADLSTRKSVRQRGFQETPTVELTRPISKKSTCIMSVDQAINEIPSAFIESLSPRRGPVVIDFPMDIQRKVIEKACAEKEILSSITAKSSLNVAAHNLIDMEDAVRHAGDAKRPIILLGQGALLAGCFEKYIAMAEYLDAFIVTSFMGVGAYDTEDKRCLGYIGHTGHIIANKAVFECDYLLVLGSRLDVRQTGTVVTEFVPNGKVAWVDSDMTELSNPRVHTDWKFNLDIEEFCSLFMGYATKAVVKKDNQWFAEIFRLSKESWEDRAECEKVVISPKDVLLKLKKLMADHKAIITTGVGCHQHWAARHLSFKPHFFKLLTSGGHGTMGYDLPSAIGAAIAAPDSRVLCVVGDGSLMMNIQELASLAERNLNVKILVMNNNRLGIVSQFQLITWGSDPTTGNFKAPDFVLISRGFGIEADRLDSVSDIGIKLEEFWCSPGPSLLDVSIDNSADIKPMLLAGQNMGQMWMGRETL